MKTYLKYLFSIYAQDRRGVRKQGLDTTVNLQSRIDVHGSNRQL